LINFYSECSDNGVDIKWSTASEINNDYFLIERSSDGNNFESFAKVKGAGNSSETLQYSVTDNDPYPLTVYYRLSQVDFNGESHAYNIVSSTGCKGSGINIFSYEDAITISVNAAEDAEYTITVFDAMGKAVINQLQNIVKGKNEIKLQSSQGKGIYIVKLQNGNNIYTQKIVIR
jgi:predicted DNA binding protein